jgi:hypothetical protein
MSDEYDFTINVPVRNEWANVSLLVTSVQNCFNAMFANVKGSRTVAMVTGELLENAIKYGDWENSTQYLRLAVSGRADRARIMVDNPTTPAGFDELKKSLDWMNGFDDAEAAFRARLLAIATTADPAVSRLGIVRIAYEGRCTLNADYRDGVVSVYAELTL